MPIDDLTDGGPIFGTRWYVLGPPDAAKTALLLQIADTFSGHGVLVGVLAVDEEPTDVQTRLLQRRGFSRLDCEQRECGQLTMMRAALANLPVRYYDYRYTIEDAATDLARHAQGRRCALFVDSVQSVECDAAREEDDLSERALVTKNVRAIRAVATKHRMIVVAASEMNRNSYGTIQKTEDSKRAGDMAAGKESGAIEYSGRVILSLRSVDGRPDLIEVLVVKNKHGRSRQTFYLQLDRSRMTLTPIAGPSAEEREALKNKKELAKHAVNAARVAVFLAREPGATKNSFYSGLRATYGGFGEKMADVALRTLGSAIGVKSGANRSTALYLDGQRLPKNVLDLVAAADRQVVLCARWVEGCVVMQ